MPTFSYQASDVDGQTVAGEISAENVSAAIAELESQGLQVQSIQKMQTPTGMPSPLPDLTSSLDHRFEEVLARRDVLIPALNAFAEEMPDGRCRRDVHQLVSGLQQDIPADEFRQQYAKWLPLLENGIASESTSQSLTSSIDQAIREGESRRRLRSALTYPLFALALAMLVLVMLCMIVVPAFVSTFEEFGMRLSPLTLLLVTITEAIQFHPIRFLSITFVIAASAFLLLRLWIHFALSTRLLGLFTAGNAANVNAMASLTGQLADLLSVNVSMPEALRIAGRGCQHRHFQRVAEELARTVSAQQAQQDVTSISQSPVAHNFPGNVIHALSAGPSGTPSVPLLRELSALYRDRASERTDWTTGVLAQLSIVLVGVVVAFVVIALFMPMITLISEIT